eukprot:15452642-Alexandrium_andersonii.AAC.1
MGRSPAGTTRCKQQSAVRESVGESLHIRLHQAKQSSKSAIRALLGHRRAREPSARAALHAR